MWERFERLGASIHALAMDEPLPMAGCSWPPGFG
jgi:hypothetical protein